MALLALGNLVIVLFDLSYIHFRDFYLRQFPEFTWWYGEQFKGIEPHRTTTAYLERVQDLEEQLERQGETGLGLPQTQTILSDLQSRSAEMIDEDPFQVADKSGTLERIKNRMVDHVNVESSKRAFNTFWSTDHLRQGGWPSELEFFNSEIRPLIETNYYRGIGINGEPLDLFWRIDIWFFALFGTEFLVRTLYLSLKYKGTNWFDTMLWRWFDVLLLIPFWRWMRVVPVTIRLNQAKIVNLIPIQARIVRSILASVAIELTEIVVIRIIDQVQSLIRKGEVTRMLLNPEAGRRYIDINGVDEVQALSQRLMSTLIYEVLPQLKPEIQAIIAHSVTGAFDQSPVYRGIQSIPGIGKLPDQVTRQVASDVTDNAYNILKSSLDDPVGAELFQQLTTKLADTFRAELRDEKSVEELQYLLTMILEEVKINYVKRLSDEDVEELMDTTYKLYETIQIGNQQESGGTITVKPRVSS